MSWPNLPLDLLSHISSFLPSSIDTTRFRSICSSFRSSTPPPIPNPQFTLKPMLDSSGSFHLSKRSIYHITHEPRLSDPNSLEWLVKVDEDGGDIQNVRILNPLSEGGIMVGPLGEVKVFNFMSFKIVKLCQEYVLRYIGKPKCPYIGDVYSEKVAYNDGVVMTIHVSGKMAMYRFEDESWVVVKGAGDGLGEGAGLVSFDDVVVYKRRFYSVDYTGRAMVVSVNGDVVGDGGMSLKEVSGALVSNGDRKVLVVMNEELYLVDRYLNIGYNDDMNMWEEDRFYLNTTSLFKVYKLDEERKVWVEVTDLGDRVVFLGDNCVFSAECKDFEGLSGNSIFFVDKQALGEDFVSVFHMKDGSVERSMAYNQLCCPPLSWFNSPAP